jgi:hypothetical protein
MLISAIIQLPARRGREHIHPMLTKLYKGDGCMPTPKHDGSRRNRGYKVRESEGNLEIEEIDVDNVCLIKNGEDTFVGIKEEDSTSFYGTFSYYYDDDDSEQKFEKVFSCWLKEINIGNISSIKFSSAATISYKLLPEKLKILLKKMIDDFIYAKDRSTRFIENVLFDGSLDKLLKEIRAN